MKKPILLAALLTALVTSAAPAMATIFLPQSIGPAGLSASPSAPGPQLPAAVPLGLYVQVLDGAIVMSNKGGTQNFSAGQFGFTASVVQPPVIVPKNPAIQFTPPPVFNSASGPGSTNANGSAAKSNNVDCEVR